MPYRITPLPPPVTTTVVIEFQVVARPGDRVRYLRDTGTRNRIYRGIVERIEIVSKKDSSQITYIVNAGRRDQYSTTDRIHKVYQRDIIEVLPNISR